MLVHIFTATAQELQSTCHPPPPAGDRHQETDAAPQRVDGTVVVFQCAAADIFYWPKEEDI